MENKPDEKASAIEFAYQRMRKIRTELGDAGYEIGKAVKDCEGIGGTEHFQRTLNEVGAKIAYLLGDCINFCDNQQMRVDAETERCQRELKRVAEEEARKNKEHEEAERLKAIEEANKQKAEQMAKERAEMAVAEDEKQKKTNPLDELPKDSKSENPTS